MLNPRRSAQNVLLCDFCKLFPYIATAVLVIYTYATSVLQSIKQIQLEYTKLCPFSIEEIIQYVPNTPTKNANVIVTIVTFLYALPVSSWVTIKVTIYWMF